jgi:cytochrome d ubiquinol oxidase subunit I
LTLYARFLWQGKLFDKNLLLKILAFSVILPQIANQMGNFTAEMGRQSWIVNGPFDEAETTLKII